jgi:hypothetical protein
MVVLQVTLLFVGCDQNGGSGEASRPVTPEGEGPQDERRSLETRERIQELNRVIEKQKESSLHAVETYRPTIAGMPNQSHPHYSRFALLRVQSTGQDYAEQKEYLEKLNQKNGDDIFVATFNGIQNKETDDVFSYAVWPKDVPTWLPRVDKLALMRSEDDQPEFVDWETVVGVASDLMTPLDMYPKRFRVTEFPSEEQLQAMGME